MISPGGVDEQHVGKHRQSAHRSLQAWAFAEREQTRQIWTGGRAGDRGLSYDAASEKHGSGRPRGISRLAPSAKAALEDNGARADDERPGGRPPRLGGRGRELDLHAGQLLG
jgi:hypothetical protein